MTSNNDGTAFRDKGRKDGKRDILFNRGEEDGAEHGHVVESEDEAGDRTYHHARDVEGNVYVDDSREAPADSYWGDASAGDRAERRAAMMKSAQDRQRQANRGRRRR